MVGHPARSFDHGPVGCGKDRIARDVAPVLERCRSPRNSSGEPSMPMASGPHLENPVPINGCDAEEGVVRPGSARRLEMPHASALIGKAGFQGVRHSNGPTVPPPIVEALPEFIWSISGRRKCLRREPYRSPPTGQWCRMIPRHAKGAIAGFAAQCETDRVNTKNKSGGNVGACNPILSASISGARSRIAS